MNRVSPARSRAAALLLVSLSAMGAIVWLWLTSSRTDTNFLPHMAPAEWIVSASAPEVTPRPRINLETTFERSFNLSNAPAQAELRVAGFHEYALSINGSPVPNASQRGGNWKAPDRFDVTKLLRAGENQISVKVSNTNGPAALWLALSAEGFRLQSDESWKASCAGAEWTTARLATRPKPIVTGGPLSDGTPIWENFRALWFTFLIFAALSATAYWLGVRWANSGDSSAKGGSWKREIIPLLAACGLWVALFVNNLTVLPFQGFDADGHLAYVSYILDRHALPLANEGWEMFQPPLYYLVCAGVLKILGLHTWQDEAVMVLRIVGLLIAVAHIVIIWACLRLLFPENRSRQIWGALLAAFLPALLYLSQYITNEAAGATAVSGCVYLTLRILRSGGPSWKLFAALGGCLGVALLTKITAVLLLPVVLVALIWKCIGQSASSVWRRGSQLLFVVALCLGVCGWHYARVWIHFHNSPTVAWVPTTDILWWQDDGYRTGAFYLRFGQALVNPWFSGFQSFPDGIYSTLWGDGLFGGSGDFLLRPPWNYDLMSAGYWLALLPSLAIIIGAIIAIGKFVRQPSAELFLLLGLAFLAGLAVVHLTVTVPYCSVVKAFYGLSAMVPLCVFGGLGLDFLYRKSGRMRPLVCVLFGVWALTSVASFWVSGSNPATVLARARTLAKSGRASDAIQTLAAALQWYPQSAEIHCLLAEILMPIDQGPDAANHAELAVTQNPTNAECHLALSMALTSRNQLKEAEAEAQKAMELAPGNTRACSQFGALLVQQGNYDEAERVIRRGLAVSPFSPELRLQLGVALINRHQYTEGMTQIQLAGNLGPTASTSMPHGTDPGATTSESQQFRQDLDASALLFNQGNLSEAIRQYQVVLKLTTNSAQAHCGLGEALAKQGDLENAAEHFDEALKTRPDFAPALIQLGIVRARQGKLDDAFRAISEATRLTPNNPMAHNYLGNVLAQQGKPGEAVAEFETALQLNPDLALAHNNLAISYKKLGRTGDAITHYRKALRLNPDFPDSLNNLAWALATVPDAQFRNGAEAVILAARACEITRYQKPVPLATLAAACAEQGRFNDAIACAERALQLTGGQGAWGTMLPAMLEAFRAHQPYRAN